MRNSLLVVFALVSCQTFSQEVSSTESNRRLETDVFTLSACSPNLISIQREGENIDRNKKASLSRLSINVNRFSAFKVENINPLRYSFYIKNESVSQFFDATDIILGNSLRDTANLKINDIEILQFFKKDSVSSNKKLSIEQSKNRVNLLRDTLQELGYALDEVFRKIDKTNGDVKYYYELDSVKAMDEKKKSAELEEKYNKTIDSINKAYAKQYSKWENEINILTERIESINANGGELLNDIITISDKEILAQKVGNITLVISKQAGITKANIETTDELLKSLSTILSDLKTRGSASAAYYHGGTISGLTELLEKLKNVKVFALNKTFIIDENKLQNGNPLDQRSEIYKIHEFGVITKIQLAEAFVTFASLQIGKLLQNAIIDCSRFQNQLTNETCIKDKRSEIDVNLEKDSLIYNYIQDISADLNVFINSLALDNASFNDMIKNINDNYKALLKFIKTIDFVAKNNTKEFTLPSHNNLRNYDLIRYSIERKDKITGRTETYPYDIWIKGGFKVDFSVAILISQLNDITYNKNALFSTPIFDSATGSYTSEQRSDSFYLKKADAGKYNFAFGGMVNLMWRTGASWVTPGISLGIAYSAGTNSKLQFLASGSLQFGKTERLIAHFGIVAGQQQQLDLSQLNYNPKTDILDGGNTYKVKGDFSTMTAPYNYKFVFKPFFGISYNLSKKNALNAVGSNADNFNGALPK